MLEEAFDLRDELEEGILGDDDIEDTEEEELDANGMHVEGADDDAAPIEEERE